MTRRPQTEQGTKLQSMTHHSDTQPGINTQAGSLDAGSPGAVGADLDRFRGDLRHTHTRTHTHTHVHTMIFTESHTALSHTYTLPQHSTGRHLSYEVKCTLLDKHRLSHALTCDIFIYYATATTILCSFIYFN